MLFWWIFSSLRARWIWIYTIIINKQKMSENSNCEAYAKWFNISCSCYCLTVYGGQTLINGSFIVSSYIKNTVYCAQNIKHTFYRIRVPRVPLIHPVTIVDCVFAWYVAVVLTVVLLCHSVLCADASFDRVSKEIANLCYYFDSMTF